MPVGKPSTEKPTSKPAATFPPAKAEAPVDDKVALPIVPAQPDSVAPPHGQFFHEKYYELLHLQFCRDNQTIGDWGGCTDSYQRAFRKLVDQVARSERYPR